MKTLLTIAGSDCSGGAGIQADLKTMAAHGVYGMSAITALTAQNTTGVYQIMESTPDFLASQLDCVFTDIFPDGVKIGMVSSPALIQVIGEKLRQYHPGNLVLDPVMISTSGHRLMQEEGIKAITQLLFPLAAVITPNIPEAETLSGIQIENEEQMEKAAVFLGDTYSTGILLKGGHLSSTADDLLYDNGKLQWFPGERVQNPNTHGTGCTLSTAIACNLALGYSLPQAVERGKRYLTAALKYGLDLGKGSGPLNHCIRSW